MDTVSGTLRMTFGSTELLRGFDFLVVVIGLFGISEILMTMEEGVAFRASGLHRPQGGAEDLGQLPRYWMTLIRSSIIGCWLGVTPGGARRHRSWATGWPSVLAPPRQLRQGQPKA
jgi:TctA family transporter